MAAACSGSRSSDPGRGGAPPGGSCVGGGAVAIVRWNVLPSPGTPALSAHIVPPIASASRLEIASPRPVPPYLRLVAASAWLNDWNMRPIDSGRDADARVAHGDVELEGAALVGRRRVAR